MKQRTSLIALCSFLLMSFCVSKSAIKYEKGAAVVNTTSIVKARFPWQDAGEDIHPQRQGAEDSGAAQPGHALGVRTSGDAAEEVRGQECRRGGADEGGRRERCHLLVESPHTEREGRTEILPREQEVEFLT